MNSFDLFFQQELVKALQEERQSRLEALAKRVSPDDYLVRVGYLQALQWLEDTCVEIERKLKAPMSNEGNDASKRR